MMNDAREWFESVFEPTAWKHLDPKTKRGIKAAGAIVAAEVLFFPLSALISWQKSGDPSAFLNASLSHSHLTSSHIALIVGNVLFLGALIYAGFQKANHQYVPGEGFVTKKQIDKACRSFVPDDSYGYSEQEKSQNTQEDESVDSRDSKHGNASDSTIYLFEQDSDYSTSPSV